MADLTHHHRVEPPRSERARASAPPSPVSGHPTAVGRSLVPTHHVPGAPWSTARRPAPHRPSSRATPRPPGPPRAGSPALRRPVLPPPSVGSVAPERQVPHRLHVRSTSAQQPVLPRLHGGSPAASPRDLRPPSAGSPGTSSATHRRLGSRPSVGPTGCLGGADVRRGRGPPAWHRATATAGPRSAWRPVRASVGGRRRRRPCRRRRAPRLRAPTPAAAQAPARPRPRAPDRVGATAPDRRRARPAATAQRRQEPAPRSVGAAAR